MKFLILGAIAYLFYRLYYAPKKLQKGSDDFPQQRQRQKEEQNDYTDYEELE